MASARTPRSPRAVVRESAVAVVVGGAVLTVFVLVFLASGETAVHPRELAGTGSGQGIAAFVLWVVVVPLAVLVLVSIVRLVRYAPDLTRREVVDGQVVDHQRVPYTRYMDGHSDLLLTYGIFVRERHSGVVSWYDLGSEDVRGRVGGKLFYRIAVGDWVTIHLAPRTRFVVEVVPYQDSGGRGLPAAGRIPATPDGAPVDTAEFMRILRAPIPRIEVTDAHSGGYPARRWSYHFDGVTEISFLVAHGVGASPDVSIEHRGTWLRFRVPSYRPQPYPPAGWEARLLGHARGRSSRGLVTTDAGGPPG